MLEDDTEARKALHRSTASVDMEGFTGDDILLLLLILFMSILINFAAMISDKNSN